MGKGAAAGGQGKGAQGKGEGAKLRKPKKKQTGYIPHPKKDEAQAGNPFEKRFNRTKHSVVSLRPKRTEFSTAEARERGQTLREETLMVEFQQQGKRNTFADRRIGEDNEELTADDKMLMRYQREKLARARTTVRDQSKFQLNEEEELTHFGQSLGDEDGDMPGDWSDDEGGHGGLDDEYTRTQNFGGGDGDENEEELFKRLPEGDERKKTKKEAMDEIIAKSKAFKAERRKDKEENEDLLEELDGQFDDIRALLNPSKGPTKDKDSKKPALDAHDDYEAKRRALVFDYRSKATDRLKSPAEEARDEAARLQKLEEERLRRMRGDEPPDNEGGVSREDLRGKIAVPSQKRRKTADDLSDEEGEEEEQALVYKDGVAQQQFKMEMVRKGGKPTSADAIEGASDNSGASEDEEESEGEGEGAEAEEGSDDGEGASDEGDESGSDGAEAAVKALAGLDEEVRKENNHSTRDRQKRARRENAPVAGMQRQAIENEELPFTFEVPSDAQGLEDLLGPHTAADQATILERLRAGHHVSLHKDNRGKIQRLYSLLWTWYGEAVERASSARTLGAKQRELLDAAAFARMDTAKKHMQEMARDIEMHASTVARGTLERIVSECGAHKGGKDVELRWPRPASMQYLQLMSDIFPPSDFKHPVMTPLALLIAWLLARCPLSDGRAAVCGLFLCELSMRNQSEARRFVPEVHVFLTEMLCVFVRPAEAAGAAAPETFGTQMDDVITSKPHVTWTAFVDAEAWPAKAPSPIPRLSRSLVMRLDAGGLPSGVVFSAQCLDLCISLLGRAVALCAATESAAQIVAPVQAALALRSSSGARALPKKSGLRAKHSALVASCAEIAEAANERREPLQLMRRRAIPIKTLDPVFDEQNTRRRSGPQTKISAGEQKRRDREAMMLLKRQHKKELRATARELRKDAVFVEEQRMKKVAKHKEFQEGIRKNFNTVMQTQASEMNGKKKKFGKHDMEKR